MAIEIFEHDFPCSEQRVFAVNLHETRITVTVTANASVARRWIHATRYFYRSFLDRLVVGLGVQWTPGPRDNPADTLQLCVGRRCLIYQLAQADYVPRALRTFLLNPCYTFVGFWNHSDRRRLEISEYDLQMLRDPLDLRIYAETNDGESLAKAPVEEIIEECLGYSGVELKRQVSLSDWDDEFLSDDQVLQATLDARCAFLIGKNIKAWRFSR